MRLALSLLTAASLAMGCAHVAARSAPPTLVCPARGGAQWRELTSQHFHVVTDLPSEDARMAVWAAERSWERIDIAFRVYFPDGIEIGSTELVLFAHAADLRRLRPGTGVSFLSSDDRGRPLIVTYVGDGTTGNRYADLANRMHFGLAHRLLERRLARPPLWLALGLSGFLVGAASRGGYLELGAATMAPFASATEIADTLEALLHSDVETWDVAARASYDRVALLVVHWLADGTREQQHRLQALLAAAERGVDARRAFVETVGEPATIAADLMAHASAIADGSALLIQRYSLPQAADYEAGGERQIDEAELHHLWAELGDPAQLDDALAHAPNAPLVHWWLAARAERHGDQVTADAEAARAIALAPNEPRWRCERAVMHMRRATGGDAAARRLAAAEADDAAASADDARTLNAIAWYFSKMGHPERGLPLAQRAVALQPESWQALDTLSTLLMQVGRQTEARAVEKEAFAHVPAGAHPGEDMRARLTRSRESDAP